MSMIGFRSWLFRLVAAVFGLSALFISITLGEVSRFYQITVLGQPAVIGVVVGFLIFTSSLVGDWTWRRYGMITLVTGSLFTFAYLAFRPEMFRDDILAQLKTPALSADLVIYRGLYLRDDPQREIKIERVGYLYSFLKSYSVPNPPTNLPRE